MSEHAPTEKPLPTIWRVPDELWEKIEPILAECDPPKSTGTPSADGPAGRPGRYHLPIAHRLPVEPPAQGVPRRLLGASHLPAVGRTRGARVDLGGIGRGV